MDFLAVLCKVVKLSCAGHDLCTAVDLRQFSQRKRPKSNEGQLQLSYEAFEAMAWACAHLRLHGWGLIQLLVQVQTKVTFAWLDDATAIFWLTLRYLSAP